MAEKLLSVGLDVGTTSTQMIVSELRIENRASSFAVPDMEITERNIRYKSPVHFTPLLDESHVDGQKLRQLVDEEYAAAGITRADVDTGAVIITGETSRKENARAVLSALTDLAGDFVVATAGPDLESVLAARGAGAVAYSEQTGKTVLHVDIGGGTSNLAFIESGKIVATGCLNVGGRLVKFDENRRIHYVSPVLGELCKLKPGDMATEQDLEPVAQLLTQALEMAAGLRQPNALLEKLTTREIMEHRFPRGKAEVLSFSGGVADCIGQEIPWQKFGDMGPILGRAIRNSLLCRDVYRLGEETIRATVIGAGCHSAQLSGSTVFYRNVRFPMKSLPAVALGEQEQLNAQTIRSLLARQEGDTVVLALPGIRAPHHAQIAAMAEVIAEGFGTRPVVVALEQDMAKALGHALALRLPGERQILCIDNVRLSGDSYLDVGAPVGPALPIVVKTLILNR